MILSMTSEKENESTLNREHIDFCISKVADKSDRHFEELYKLTSPSVYSYALSVLKNTYDAQDVMHDSYIHIYQSADSYKSSGKPMAWILTITKNLCLQKIRDKSKVSDIPEDEWERTLVENKNLLVEDKLLIEKCMNVLTDEERQIIVLHAVAGFKHKEIATHMDLLLSTVLSKYNRAIKKLKIELEKEQSTQ